MQRFKNILVHLNYSVGDDDTLAQAVALARKNNAKLTIVEVFECLATSSAEISEREKQLQRLATSFFSDGVTINSIVAVGTPFLEIIRLVLKDDYDLVMMTAEGKAGYTQLFFGSTSLHLLRKCPCPVWVTKPETHSSYTRLMAAVALESDDDCELDSNIMSLATSLTRLHQGELHIANAWEVTGKDLDTLKSEFTDKMKDRILTTHEGVYQKRADKILTKFNVDDIESHVQLMRGKPEYELPKFSNTSQIDLIVMGTIGRTGIPGFFIGNSAELILRQVKCSVLVVKPEGFVTPVTLA